MFDLLHSSKSYIPKIWNLKEYVSIPHRNCQPTGTIFQQCINGNSKTTTSKIIKANQQLLHFFKAEKEFNSYFRDGEIYKMLYVGTLQTGYPRTSFKSRQRARRASTRRHVPCGTISCLPVKVGSTAATSQVAPDPATLLGRTPVPPRVQWLRTLPPC
jgi:hypothetical protein